MSFGARMVNYLSMAAGGAVGLAVGWVIYQRTMARAAELAREANAAEEGRSPFSPGGGPGPEYADQEDGLMDPEDAAALMSDDDMSLWENPGGDWDDREDGQSGEATTTKHTRQDSW